MIIEFNEDQVNGLIQFAMAVGFAEGLSFERDVYFEKEDVLEFANYVKKHSELELDQAWKVWEQQKLTEM